MKILFTFLSLALGLSCFGQVIRSNTPQISIRDNGVLLKDYWTISPAARPDVYESVSTKRSHKVTFITDIDSITFDVKLGEKYSFVVVLNNKDSAFTQISGVKQLTGMPTVIPPKKLTASQLKGVGALTVPLQTVLASKPGEPSSFDDLEPFKQAVGNAQIIALGESTHGTSEFFSLKHRLLQYAVIHLNVRVFAIEDNQLNAELINQYVLHGKGELRELMRGLFGVWVRQEVVDLIEWIRNYNLVHPTDPVEFVGIDMQNPMLAFDSLNSFLSQQDAQMQKEIYELFTPYWRDFSHSFTASDEEKSSWYASSQKAIQMMQAQKPNWLHSAKNKNDTLAIEWALQNSKVIWQCAKGVLTGHMQLFRDSAMADNVKWILSMRKPGTRMVLWAHDFHISRGDHPIATSNYYNGISMGSWLSKWYGESYKSFGIETYQGEFTAMKTYTDFDLIQCALTISPVGTLDESLHRIAERQKEPYLFIDLKQVKGNSRKYKWLSEPTFVRFANHVCEGNSYGLQHVIPYQFDGIFFIDRTTGSKLID